MYLLIAARFFVGAGSGGAQTVAVGLSHPPETAPHPQAIIISDLVSLRDRGVYQGVTSLMYGLGTAAGAAVGGAITDLYGWRMTFWIQVPLPLMCAAMVIWQVAPEQGKTEGSAWGKLKRIDWAGSFVTLVSVRTGVSFRTSKQWGSCARSPP